MAILVFAFITLVQLGTRGTQFPGPTSTEKTGGGDPPPAAAATPPADLEDEEGDVSRVKGLETSTRGLVWDAQVDPAPVNEEERVQWSVKMRELFELREISSFDMGDEVDEFEYCERVRKNVAVFRLKGYQQQGVPWLEKIVRRMLEAHCSASSECEMTPYTRDAGTDVEFPTCGAKWTFLVKSPHTNHAGPAKARALGFGNLFMVRDPRDAMVSYFELKVGAFDNRQQRFDAFFAETFQKMLHYMADNAQRSWEAGGIVVLYEELYSDPLAVLTKLAEILGVDVAPELLTETVVKSSFLTSTQSGRLKVLAAVEKKGSLKSEDNFSGVGEYKTYPYIQPHLETIQELMERILPPKLNTFYSRI